LWPPRQRSPAASTLPADAASPGGLARPRALVPPPLSGGRVAALRDGESDHRWRTRLHAREHLQPFRRAGSVGRPGRAPPTPSRRLSFTLTRAPILVVVLAASRSSFDRAGRGCRPHGRAM